MTLRNGFYFLAILLSGTPALAHDGDHTGMTQTTVQLHHIGLPIAMIAIALVVLVAFYFRRSSVRDTRNAANRR